MRYNKVKVKVKTTQKEGIGKMLSKKLVFSDGRRTLKDVELIQEESTALADNIGDLLTTLIVDKGLSFKSAKREIRQTVTSFVGHEWLD